MCHSALKGLHYKKQGYQYVHVVHLESSRKVFLILVCLFKFLLREIDVNHLWFDLGTGSKSFTGVFTWATGAIHYGVSKGEGRWGLREDGG